MFDNRWCVFHQDMPSAEKLLSCGISKVIARTHQIRNDLTHVLLKYRTKGIKVYHSNPLDDSRAILVVPKPSLFESMSYRAKTISGLSRCTAGGFGKYILSSSDSSYSG